MGNTRSVETGNKPINFKRKTMNLNLEPNEVQFILQVLGELPTKTGAFVLLKKIDEQAVAQNPTQVETPSATA
jgi:hypothetical protein